MPLSAAGQRPFVGGLWLLGMCIGGCPTNAINNATNPVVSVREPLSTKEGVTYASERGLEDAVWLEVAADGAAAPVGGYLSIVSHTRPALVLLLDGASTFNPGGSVGSARAFGEGFGAGFRAAGFRTWSLALPECGTPYASADLDAAGFALDWLEAGGKGELGVERVYIAGFSVGGTVALHLDLRRDLSAVAVLAPLSSPDQLERFRGLYLAATRLLPFNEGFCQMRSTVVDYGPPGSPAWDVLDALDRLAELRNPTLFIHGEPDVVYLVENTRRIEKRYAELTARGTSLPPAEFEYLPLGIHTTLTGRPEVQKRVLDFFLRHEPPAVESDPPGDSGDGSAP